MRGPSKLVTLICGLAITSAAMTACGSPEATATVPASTPSIAIAATEIPTSPPPPTAITEDHFRKGIVLKEEGKLLEAIAAFNQAILLEPKNQEAFNH